MNTLNLSIVIPLFNEDESLPELTDWIAKVMDRESYTYEIIFVNDGSMSSNGCESSVNMFRRLSVGRRRGIFSS